MIDLGMIFVPQTPPDFVLQEEFWWKVVQRGQYHFWTSLVAQWVKNLPAVQESQVRSLGQEDPLQKGMATHSSNLAWRIPWTEEPGGLQSMASKRDGHDLGLNSNSMFIIGFCVYPVGIHYFPWQNPLFVSLVVSLTNYVNVYPTFILSSILLWLFLPLNI